MASATSFNKNKFQVGFGFPKIQNPKPYTRNPEAQGFEQSRL